MKSNDVRLINPGFRNLVITYKENTVFVEGGDASDKYVKMYFFLGCELLTLTNSIDGIIINDHTFLCYGKENVDKVYNFFKEIEKNQQHRRDVRYIVFVTLALITIVLSL